MTRKRVYYDANKDCITLFRPDGKQHKVLGNRIDDKELILQYVYDFGHKSWVTKEHLLDLIAIACSRINSSPYAE